MSGAGNIKVLRASHIKMLPTLDQMSKGEIGNVKAVLDTVCNIKDRPPRFMDFDHTPTLMEMCIKYGEPFMTVLRQNKEMKNLHSQNGHGYWLKNNRLRARWTAEIPVEISGNRRNPLYWQYFHPECTDPVEKRKLLYKFLRKYDMAFSPIEKL